MFVETMPDDVTWFSSSQQGAPQMMGRSNGDMLKVLDACAVDGFGEATATSVTKDLDETTIDFGVGHGYLSRQKVFISGAVDPLLNGLHKIKSLTATTITIYTPAVTSIAGTIIVKVSPLGWESIFGKTDPLKRAYRSLSPTSAKRVLYLDMEHPSVSGYNSNPLWGTKRASVRVCGDMQVLGEQIAPMSDKDNGNGSIPNGVMHWYQKRGRNASDSVNNSTSMWTIIGNADFFYFIVGWCDDIRVRSLPICDVYAFGEYVGLYDDARDKTFLMASYNYSDTEMRDIGELGAQVWSDGSFQSISAWIVKDGVLKNEKLSVKSCPISGSFTSGDGEINYPNANGNALFTVPIRVAKSDSPQIYGMLPSIAFIENKIIGNTYNGTIVDDLLLVSVAQNQGPTERYGYYAFYVGG